MPIESERLDYLLEAYIKQRCSEAERLELMRLIHEGQDQDTIREWMDQSRRHFIASYELNEQSADQIFTNILQSAPAAVVPIHATSKRAPVPLVWWAAAAVLIAVGFGTLWLLHPFSPAPPVAQTLVSHNDVAPGATRARLTLANGQQIVIDTAAIGTLAVQGRTEVVKTNGDLHYKGQYATAALYNTLSTGRGEQSPPLTLSDGTKVWLDAASSIRFPVVFTGRQRVVEITGQPYFEVAQNAAMPFIVKKGDLAIEVLGTHFNVNAYDDNADMRVTLLEGAVRVRKGTQSATIQPGDQAVVDGNMISVNKADVSAVMAWKNGLFSFDEADLPAIMKQLARWYDVEVVYEGTVTPRSFGGKMQRDLNLSTVLHGLEKNKVHFRIEGKKIIVLP